MGKVSVTVQVPALGSIHDFIVPDNLQVRDIQHLMIKILHSEYGSSENVSDAMLFDMRDGGLLRQECSFSQMNISDGTKLVLV